METSFSPKQVAAALGVSESTVKRWVDGGRLAAVKTLGGHRKIPLKAIVKHLQDSDQAVAKPELLGLVATTVRSSPEDLQEVLFDQLVDGDEQGVRNLLLGLYQQGVTPAELGDELISPVFRRIGHCWEEKTLEVHHERRSCAVVQAVLHEIRSLLPAPPESAPLALCASLHQDFAETPLRLVELTLMSAGWNACMAGAGLPVDQVCAAIRLRRPRLVCLSATHVADVPTFVDEVNEVLAANLDNHMSLVVGGMAMEDDRAREIECDRITLKLADLVEHLGELCD